MARIELKNISKSFGKTEVIQGVNLQIEDGEFMVIVGPSGCGKSTLLRMIAGLESVTEGEISIGDKVVNELEPAARDIAMVFQNYALYPHMSVFKNMAYGLKIRGVAKDEIRRRVEQAAGILEIGEFLKRSPRQLSGGQRQRVAMGRAIVREPSVFLFDEPLSNLDAKLRVQMRLEIKKLQTRLGITSVYVTHDQVEAMTLGHRLMVLNDGLVEQLGTPIELYNRPASRFVAGFIGSPAMNFMHATVADGAAQAELAEGVCVSLPADVRLTAGQAVVLGMRPEHLVVGGEQGLILRIELVEQLGADTLIHGQIGDVTMTVRREGVFDATPGSELALSIDAERIHVFAADDGRRL